MAALLADDPVALTDVAAARASRRRHRATDGPQPHRSSAPVASSTTPPPTRQVIPFRADAGETSSLQGIAGWGSLVAAIAVASWLGFTIGIDTSLSFNQPAQTNIQAKSDDSFLPELLDPATGFMRDLRGGSQT